PPAACTHGDAGGLPIMPALAGVDEIQGGLINHAVRFTLSCAGASHIWPARHTATGSCSAIPFGARFRLKTGYNISGFSAQTQVVLRALRRYGMLLADIGSDWYIQ